MPSTSEKGHAVNVANLSKLIEVCKSLGARYNPAKAAIKITALEAKLAACTTDLQDLKDAQQAETNVRNSRQSVFSGKRRFATRLVAAIKASDATDETIADANSINKKIQGSRVTRLPKAKQANSNQSADTNGANGTSATATEPKTISTSQQSYISLVDHFKRLQTLITALGTNYLPNEDELKLTTLAAQITEMETLSNQVDITEAATKNILIRRDKNFYDEKTGIHALNNDVREYIKSVFGATSPEYTMVKKIVISRPTK